MTATPYLVLLPDQDTMPARTLFNSVDGFLVVAGSTADALALCQYQFDSNGVAWDQATTTAVVADTNLHGWTLNITISNPTTNAVVGSVSVVSDGVDDAG